MLELHRQIRALGDDLNMSPGELLRLARETSHNAALPSIDLITRGQALEMLSLLTKIQALRFAMA